MPKKLDKDLYSPPNRNYPQELPDYWKFEDGTVRTDLQTLTDTELEELGWHGPITMPEDIEGTSHYTHDYFWNPETLSFVAIELNESAKRERVNYNYFWYSLITGTTVESIDVNGKSLHISTNGIAYKKIKDTAKVSLEANVIVTEFIAYLSDAKVGNANVEKIQEIISEISSKIPFTEEELFELQEIFTESGMFAVYTLS